MLEDVVCPRSREFICVIQSLRMVVYDLYLDSYELYVVDIVLAVFLASRGCKPLRCRA